MLSRKSIKGEFALKLLPAIVVFVFSFSYVVYSLIVKSIYDDIKSNMLIVAEDAIRSQLAVESLENQHIAGCLIQTVNYSMLDTSSVGELVFEEVVRHDRHFLYLYYPYDFSQSSYLKISKEITNSIALQAKIKNIILITNFIVILFVPIFAYIFSIFLARPIQKLSSELSKMDEHSLKQINQLKLPDELKPLSKTLNNLLTKLNGHIRYQRELFTGIAHELKTPLAIIRTKNDVTLLKDRDIEKYKDVLRATNGVVDEMNKMTGTILEIGRAEYAQFDPPEVINIAKFLRDKIEDFALLAKKQNKTIESQISPDALMFLTRPTLISHIVQNLVTNAIKFAKEKIEIKTYLQEDHFYIEVLDDGGGLDENIDIFAPFIAKGEARGAGLGLYLAKNAAESLAGTLHITNCTAGGAKAVVSFEYVKPQV